MKQNEVTLMKDEIRKNVEELLPEFIGSYCTLEIISNHDDEQKLKFYITNAVEYEPRISIIEEAKVFQELLEIVIIRARALAGEYE